MKRATFSVSALAALLGTACAHDDNANLANTGSFGAATQQTLAAQVIDAKPEYVSALQSSGQHAAQAIERYRADRVKQPERVSSTGKGGGSGGGGNGGGGEGSGGPSGPPSVASGSGQPSNSTPYVIPPEPIIEAQTGQVLLPVAGGVIDPTTGTFYNTVPGGVINTKTGQFSPVVP